jgi:arabinofuranan 3-O-arabinosyltransferase
MTEIPERPAPRLIQRLRIATAAVALVALAFSQAPGRLVGDTKSDLVLDPGAFLRRAIEAWNPQQGFGVVANQSYGYLWPMGPFFWLGHALGVPGWAVQRGWWALILVVGFTGALRLGGALGIGTSATRLLAALAYALSPRVLSVLGTISVEAWPAAVLPWILLPLVRGATGQLSARRAAAWSGLAVLCLGGVNATASAAVLPLPLLFLLTRPAGVRGRLLAWWAPATVLAVAWWALPLLVLGRYGYDFLDLIETSKVTTAATGLADTLRGSDHWLGYLVVDGRPVWTAGWDLATRPGMVLVTTLIAAAGVAGLLLPGLPDRRWLLAGAMLGTVLVAAAHTGVLTGPLAGPLQAALDGRLAALRNVHKADPVLRLPLALGLAHLLAVATRAVRSAVPAARGPTGPAAAPGGAAGQVAGLAAVPVAAALLLATLLPAWGGGLAPAGAYPATPAYWTQAADWLDAYAEGRRTLLLPSANAPVYRWGAPRDEPLQALVSAPWAVRDGAPLGAPGSTRLLDGLDARLVTGQPSPAYASVLARAGIRFVLLRNDLDPDRSGSARPAVIRAALAGSPGLTEAARFGPDQPPAFRSDDRPAGTTGADPPALEVFAVAGAERITAYPKDGAVALSGGPEGVLSLADAGLLGGRAVMGTMDAEAADAADADAAADAADDGEDHQPSPLGEAGTGADEDAVVLTDTQRRRAYNPGGDPGRRYSATLSAGDALPRPDLGPYDAAEQAVSVLEGASTVTASSSADDPFATDPDGGGYLGPDHRPAAAVDGDQETAWVSASGTVGQYLDLSLLRPMRPREVAVDVLTDPALGPEVTSVAVTTDVGTASAPTHHGQATVRLPAGATAHLRVTITGVAGDPGSGVVGIRELTVPSLRVTEAIALPPAEGATGGRWTVLAERPDGRRGDCVRGPDGWTCVPGMADPGEESGSLERRFEAAGGDVTLAGTVRPRPGLALDRLLDETIGYGADGTSRVTADPAARPGAAYDGDPATAWLPAPGDQAPRLTIALGRVVTISGLSRADWSGVAAVDLTTRTGEQRTLNRPGSFRPLRTDEVALTFRRTVGEGGVVLPMAVRGLDLAGAPARSTAPVRVDCGAAPSVLLDGHARNLAVTAPIRDLLTLAPVPATACGSAFAVDGGSHRMSTIGTAALEVASAELSTGRPPPAPPARAVRTVSWSDQHRVIGVAAGPNGYLALPEGFNDGWRATAYGRTLTPVRLDGWQQGWKLPRGGSTEVTLMFGPGRTQHALLLVGLAAALLVLPLALVPARRPSGLPSRPLAPVPGRWWRAAPVAVTGGLLIGPVGLASAAAALALPRRWWAAGAGGTVAVIGVLEAAGPDAGWVEAAGQGLAAAALCVIAAALVDWLPPDRPPGQPLGQPQRGPLDQRPGQPAEDDRAECGEHGDRDRAPAEVGPAGQVVDRIEDDQVPQEDPVRPAAEQP